jgi:hypothetical protein
MKGHRSAVRLSSQLLLCLASGAVPLLCNAQPPASSGSETAQAVSNGQTSATPGSVSASYNIIAAGESANASASTTPSPYPVVSVSGTGQNFECNGLGANCVNGDANFTYYMQVNGTSGAAATLDMYTTASVGATASGIGNGAAEGLAGASLIVEAPSLGRTLVNYSASDAAFYNGGTGGYSSNFQPMTQLTVSGGETLLIYMDANFYLNETPSNPGTVLASANASLDPFFQIDSSTLNASEFSLSFSPGVGNESPVPLPGSLGLMIMGLCALGIAPRLARRRLQGQMLCAA